VEASDTINTVKGMIQNKEGVRRKDFDLEFYGEKLVGSYALFQCDIADGAELTVVLSGLQGQWPSCQEHQGRGRSRRHQPVHQAAGRHDVGQGPEGLRESLRGVRAGLRRDGDQRRAEQELANIAKKKDEANEMLKGKGTNFTWKLQELGTYHEDLQTIEDVRNRCEGATAYYKRLLASSIWDKICKDNNGEFKMEEVRVMLAGAKDSAEMES